MHVPTPYTSINAKAKGGTPMTTQQLRLHVGTKINQARLDHGMSLEHVAQELDVTPDYLTILERGERGTTLLTLLTLSDIYDCTVDSFLR